MRFGPRERAQLIQGQDGKYVVQRPQEQPGRSWRIEPSPQVASFTRSRYHTLWAQNPL
jgi:hypothetical protein